MVRFRYTLPERFILRDPLPTTARRALSFTSVAFQLEQNVSPKSTQ